MSTIQGMIVGSAMAGLLLLTGTACEQVRDSSVSPASTAAVSSELRLRLAYESRVVERTPAVGKGMATFQDPNDAYWEINDPSDWSVWPAFLQQDNGLPDGPELDQALKIEADQAIGTLRVQAGEKFIFAACFENGALKYTATGAVVVEADITNETTLVLVPWGEESYAIDDVRVMVFHVKGLEQGVEREATAPIVDLPGGAQMEFVWIEPGTFLMGSPEDEFGRVDNEGPQHEVTISQGFYLGKYEITQGQWTAVMGTKPWQGRNNVQDNPDHPAVYISWDDWQDFIAQLNAVAGAELYRLPTEAEWEYAARAGTTTRWSFGDDESQLGDYAWYGANTFEVGLEWAQPVGTKLPNPWGLHDMHGNVLEWVSDWFGEDYYSQSPATDPQGPTIGPARIRRGGYFDTNAQFLRSAHRDADGPSDRSEGVGARLLRTQ